MCAPYIAHVSRGSQSLPLGGWEWAPNVGLLCTRLCSCSLHNRLRVGNVEFFPRSRPWPMRFTRRNKRPAPSGRPRDADPAGERRRLSATTGVDDGRISSPNVRQRVEVPNASARNGTTNQLSSGAARGLIWSPKHSAQWDQRDPQAFPDLLPGKPAHRGACQRPRRIKSAPQLSITRGYLIDEFINRQSCEGRGLDGWRFRHRSSASSWNKRSIDTVACARAVRPHANRQYASDWNRN